jgi:hypothetical protein
MSTGVDGGAAIAAAAAAAQIQRQEEEALTPYSTKDLAEDWEFKILRSNFAAFRDPAKLRAVLDEESRGGWILVEKFDDQRLRLKRRAGAKTLEGDLADGYDPYRTTIGTSSKALAILALGLCILTFMLALALIVSTH